ncbi:MAG: hypothetical protein WC846_02065 [Candidatus Gracilibacteria bacterium]|jgi:hypothetical protein
MNTAHAEPGPVILYHNAGTNECGALWIGDEFKEYRPSSSDWEEIGYLGTEDAKISCEKAGYTYVAEVPSKMTEIMDENGGDVQNESIFYAVIIAVGIVVFFGAYCLARKRLAR